MKLSTLEKLFEDQLKDLHSAEAQLLKALPRIAKRASSEKLSAAIEHHLEETQTQYERLQKIGEILGIRLSGKKCAAMEGLLEEGKEVLEADGEDAIIDAAIIASAQRVEHYEIGSYGTARTLAENLNYGDVAELLQETLDEEAAADEKLTSIAVDEIYPQLTSEATDSERQDANGTHRRNAGRREFAHR